MQKVFPVSWQSPWSSVIIAKSLTTQSQQRSDCSRTFETLSNIVLSTGLNELRKTTLHSRTCHPKSQCRLQSLNYFTSHFIASHTLNLPVTQTYITVTSYLAQWRHKSPAYRLYINVCTGADQRKHQSSRSLAFVRGIHRWTVNSPHNTSPTDMPSSKSKSTTSHFIGLHTLRLPVTWS